MKSILNSHIIRRLITANVFELASFLWSNHACTDYCIAGNFRGMKLFVVFVVGAQTTNILPMNEVTLPTFTCVQAATGHKKYYFTKWLNYCSTTCFVPRKLLAIRVIVVVTRGARRQTRVYVYIYRGQVSFSSFLLVAEQKNHENDTDGPDNQYIHEPHVWHQIPGGGCDCVCVCVCGGGWGHYNYILYRALL